jgi:hypothetical protein
MRTQTTSYLPASFALDQQARIADFAPGELDELLAVADREIERGEVLDGEDVFRKLRNLRHKKLKGIRKR